MTTRQGGHPGAEEICDGVDNDCDSEVDEDGGGPWFVDGDGDGWGDADLGGLPGCEQPPGYASEPGDCDDANAEIHPGAAERCDGLDNDCDGSFDEDLTEIWYADADGDGWGNAEFELVSCDPSSGWVQDATDCDDTDGSVYPGAVESCDGLDNDCDGDIDDDDAGLSGAFTWYLDQDDDSYGLDSATLEACGQPSGYAAQGGDCCSRPLRRRGALRWASGLAGEPSASRSTGAGCTSCRLGAPCAMATTCMLASERLDETAPAWSGSACTSHGPRWGESAWKNSPMAPSSCG